MGSKERKRQFLNDNGDGPSTSNKLSKSNYYLPLQTLIDDEKTSDDMSDSAPTKTNKRHIPPITILKKSVDDIHKICKTFTITKYSIRKISIGHKLFLELQYDYDEVIKHLKGKNIEYFSYMSKNNRPYKVVLSGLDKMDANKVKSDLCKAGLSVTDVKPVFKKTNINTEVILYVVYFQKGTITLKELREKYQNIEYVRVKWNYQSKQQNKITQCYNCQMYGHGADHCNVKTFCAKCAGAHKTSLCDSPVTKCANCNGQHSSYAADCPSRTKYINLKNRYSKPKRQISQRDSLPILQPTQTNSWANVVNTNNMHSQNYGNNDLFTVNELKSLTIELIDNLRSCKSKSEQFNVITSLAFKFLS